MKKKNNYINIIGMGILLILFLLFFIITSFFLSKQDIKKQKVNNNTNIENVSVSYNREKEIVTALYNDIKILYDVVNIKFKVDQDDIIRIGDIDYKKITNFDSVMNNLFTTNGIKKYINDMANYFAYADSGYYLAGNLVSYQTYCFRGDSTNIYITHANDSLIEGIIYEKWTSNNKNTLATIKVIKENNQWLVDDITILSRE